MANPTSKAAASLARQRRELFKNPGAGFCLRHAKAFDTYFRRRLAETPPRAVQPAVVALGGYARMELCPRSDIDVIILYGDTVPEEAQALAQALFFPLWDLGADLGHGVRGTGECLELAREDWKVFASLVDARFLAGDRNVFDDFVKRRDKELFPGRAEGFKTWLESQNVSRAATHGDAPGMLEPNLKEALGGLRDVHQVRWLDALSRMEGGGVPEKTLEVLAGHLEFLLLVRNHLHILEGRKTDRLSLDAQRELAGRLGFEASGEVKGVEAFLAALHRAMAEIRTLHRALWPLLGEGAGQGPSWVKPLGGAVVLTPEGLGFDEGLPGHVGPQDVLDVFGHAQRLRRPLTLAARHAIEGAIPELSRFAATGEGGERAFHLVLQALMEPGSETALSDMLETGVLGAAIPEFGRVQDMVQYDVFHIHPVGRHTLETIFELKKAARPGHPYHDVYARLPHPERLMLGALFHDIGKGLGGAHSEKGADISREALSRMGLDEEALSDVAFLVLRHLVLADTAVRRDISDREVLASMAQRAGTGERLDMLLLLTMADSMATGPSAWNDWKASLMGELHGRVMSVLKGGGLFDASDGKAMLHLRDRLRDKAKGLFTPERIEACLDAMPLRYLLSRAPSDILNDLTLVSRLERDLEEDARMRPSTLAGRGIAVVETTPSPGGDGWGVTLAARRQPALFATMAGVLALHGVNIRAADIFLWNDATEIHAYQTANPPDILYPDELWARVRRAVRYALTGKLSLDYRIQEKRASPLAARTPDMGIRPRVAVDNDSSEFFTVVDVRASDRLGLLYDIAVALDSLGLDVHMAKIDTHGVKVFDLFYVRGENGRKVVEPGRIKEIESLVLACLA